MIRIATLSEKIFANKQARFVKLPGSPQSIFGAAQPHPVHNCEMVMDAQKSRPTPTGRSAFDGIRFDRRGVPVKHSPGHRYV